MPAFIHLPPNIICQPCKFCGARPVIEQKEKGYYVRCPADSSHYQTPNGMIDIENWNSFNKTPTTDKTASDTMF